VCVRWREFELEPLEDHAQRHLGLEQREVLADAGARPPAEGEERGRGAPESPSANLSGCSRRGPRCPGRGGCAARAGRPPTPAGYVTPPISSSLYVFRCKESDARSKGRG
jgi:hypothetical protein